MPVIRFPIARLTACGAALLFLTATAAAEPKASPQATEFFEKRIRPLLAEKCISCHGDKRQKVGLRLDSRAALLKGSDAGPVVVPGDPDKSLLIKAVRQVGNVKMPKDSKLSNDEIDALATWVRMGVPWPDSGTTEVTKPAPPSMAELRKTHWAYQPVRRPALPQVQDRTWISTPVDYFILAQLEANGLNPAPRADKRTLLRRATFDLTGLPPTPEAIAAFEADTSPDAFARVVDRLLASPEYGERWGRHWLDVARYADTKGYVFTEERRYPYSYTYRDYVIGAFNDDLPYDQFIVQQLAADCLPVGEDNRALAAMGFLTLGRRFLNNQHDIIDDRIDVVARGLLGLTVGCARCHDHKFDPIPTRDYYSLYGVFASSVEPADLPLLGKPPRTEASMAFEKELQAREQKAAAYHEQQQAALLARYRAQTADYLLATRDAERLPGEDHYQAVAPGDLQPLMVRRWQNLIAEVRKAHNPIFGPWLAFAALPQKDFAAQAPAVAARIAANNDPKGRFHPLIAQAFAGKPPASLREVAQRYGDLFAAADKQWQELQRQVPEKSSPTPTALPDPAQEALRQVLYAPGMPATVPANEIARYFDRKVRDELTALRRKVEEWKVTAPGAPPRAMVLRDLPAPVTPHVLQRGNPNNPGEAVPRQFLLVLAGDNRKPFTHGSGRLELAQAIASKDNPLTARVMANRIWLHHFGEGLVRTPSNFGLRGELATHPELLDYLAATFMENDWSIKQLHRLIMLSSAYQQSGDGSPAAMQKDPENRLLARMNRQRLEFEELRDALLAVAGRLDPNRGGPPVDLTRTPFSTRRTVYGFIDRQNLPGLLRTFDFASPDSTSPQRHTTTVPQQALFLMNSPFVIEQARAVAARPDIQAATQPAERITRLYRLLYARTPETAELTLGLRYLETAQPEKSLTVWEKYVQVLLLANEFAFVD